MAYSSDMGPYREWHDECLPSDLLQEHSDYVNLRSDTHPRVKWHNWPSLTHKCDGCHKPMRKAESR